MTTEKNMYRLVFLIGVITIIFMFLTNKISTGFPILDIYLTLAKPYIFGILISCLIVLGTDLSLYLSDRLDEPNSPSIKILKSLTHLSIILLIIYNLAWIWAFLFLGLFMIFKNILISMIIPSIIIYIGSWVIEILAENKLKKIHNKKIGWHQFWYWLK